MSHELREPLAAIKGSAVTLLEEASALDSAEVREFHRLIVEQADHMRGLIGDLLDAGRIEAGTLSVSAEPSAVAELVERARNTFLSGGARHSVVIDLPTDLPRVMADRRRIVQVLNNLLSNAARNAPESSDIRVSAVREDDHVSVSVSDEGPSRTRASGITELVSSHARFVQTAWIEFTTVAGGGGYRSRMSFMRSLLGRPMRLRRASAGATAKTSGQIRLCSPGAQTAEARSRSAVVLLSGSANSYLEPLGPCRKPALGAPLSAAVRFPHPMHHAYSRVPELHLPPPETKARGRQISYWDLTRQFALFRGLAVPQ